MKNLEDALDFVTHEARYNVLDALYCHFFNEAGTLAGNTEANDVEWFAALLWDSEHPLYPWYGATEEEQARYKKLAALVIQKLPFLVNRMVNRYRAIADALEVLAKAEQQKASKSK